MRHYFKVCEVSGRCASEGEGKRRGMDHGVVGAAGRSCRLVRERVWEGFLDVNSCAKRTHEFAAGEGGRV